MPLSHAFLFRVLLPALLLSAVNARAGEPPREHLDYFEKHVRPVFVRRCEKCHGDEKQKGDLRLNSQAGFVAGGESGAVVVPGKPDESLLIQAIRHEAGEMPPDGKLPEQEIAAITEWVRLGAPWPKDPEGAAVRSKAAGITAADRDWWSFKPIVKPAVPVLANDAWSRTPLDKFILERLRKENIQPSAEADPRTLARRMKVDLIGLPLSAEEADAVAAADSVDRAEALLDRWLLDPQYGERWARHWLDLVRFAETDGYKQDAYRPSAWHYRDYVIRAFNQDKPYDRFVREQLAGDEMVPADRDAAAATGFLRAGIYEYNQRDVVTQWETMLNEVTDVTADVFLGLSMGCARCHDHKFDPLLQRDYFRLRSVFTPLMLRDELVVATEEEKARYEREWQAWDAKTAKLRFEKEQLEEAEIERVSKKPREKFQANVVSMFHKPDSTRTPWEQQIVALAQRQVDEETRKIDFAKVLKGEAKERWEQVTKELAALKAEEPKPLPTAPGVSDVGPVAPTTVIPGKRGGESIEPGPPSVLSTVSLDNLGGDSGVTRRRTGLVDWMTARDNPLLARVFVNRVWQFHFGTGLVPTGSDFGRLGTPPSHPELLDWLAADFIESGFQVKRLHRLILSSAVYRQASHGASAADSFAKDPSNRWLGRTNIRRLDAELIRDAALFVTGELNDEAGGPSVETKTPRRTVYTKVQRNKCDPLLEEFDAPDNILPTPLRPTTVTPNQSLLLINGGWVLDRAKSLARETQANAGPVVDDRVRYAFRKALGREPSPAEKDRILSFFYDPDGKTAKADALTDFCHVLLNSNEFLYVD